MIAPLLVFLQDPPSVEEVRQHVFKAVREVRRYRETWLLSSSEKNFRPMTIKRWLDGPRYRQEVLVGTHQVFAAGHDATTGWFVSHENKQFLEQRESNKRFEAPYEAGPVPEIGEFKLGFVSPYDLDYRATPNWKVTAFTDASFNGLPVRLLEAVSVRSEKSFINIKIHLDREGWLITRVVISGRRDDEKNTRFWQEIRVTDRQFGAPMDAQLFHLDGSTVAGYTKLVKRPDE